MDNAAAERLQGLAVHENKLDSGYQSDRFWVEAESRIPGENIMKYRIFEEKIYMEYGIF